MKELLYFFSPPSPTPCPVLGPGPLTPECQTVPCQQAEVDHEGHHAQHSLVAIMVVMLVCVSVCV